MVPPIHTVLLSLQELLAEEKWNNTVAEQEAGADDHLLHRTACVVLWWFPTRWIFGSPNSCKATKHVSVSAFVSVFSTPRRPHFLCGLYLLAFYALFQRCQVTARYLVKERIFSAVLDLLFLWAPSGRGGVAPPLTSVQDWSDHSNVAMLRSIALPCYGTLSTVCGMTFVPFF